MLVFFYTHKKYYVIHAKITSIFTIQKITMYYTHTKITIQKMLVFFYTQKILCNPRKKLLVFLPYKNYYVLHAHKKLPYKNY